MCTWCGNQTATGSFEYYDKPALFLPSGESHYELRPYAAGLGGRKLLVEKADVTSDQPGAFWAKVTLEGSHDGDDMATIYDLGDITPAKQATGVTAVAGGWRVKWLGQTVVLELPEGVDSSADGQERAWLAHAPLWLWSSPRKEQPGWQFEDAQTYLSVRRVQYREERRVRLVARRAESKDTLHRQTSDFINPYNFVPLGTGPSRAAPNGHLSLGGERLSGKIEVKCTTEGPVALSGLGDGSEQDPFRPVESATGWMLPGSTMAGAVRAFHEALTDSCLRVVDQNFTPIHREVPHPQAIGQWTMAVAQADANGFSVTPCDPIEHEGSSYSAVWVEALHMRSQLLVNSTHLFHFDLDQCEVEVSRDRLEHKNGPTPVRCTDGGCEQAHWRTIVTSAVGRRKLDPRPPKPKEPREHPYHLPFARIDPATACIPVPNPVLDDYAISAQDSHDPVANRRATPIDLRVRDIGDRQQIKVTPFVGQVLWVQWDGTHIERLSASAVWRVAGEGAVRDRIGDYWPCSEVYDLCPSCALFGMVEERQTDLPDGQPASVSAYKGHVRFGSAEVVGHMEREPTIIREMGTPRPSSGQFYLDNRGWEGRKAAARERPLRDWGSAADTPHFRRIRGRKRYWINTGTNRHAAGDDSNIAMSRTHQVLSAGATVAFPVWFDNLTSEQLGSLLVSLDPNLLRPVCSDGGLTDRFDSTAAVALSGQLGHHIGKGKGLGLGAVVPQVVSTQHAEGVVDPHVYIWSTNRYDQRSESAELSQGGLDHIRAFVKSASVATWGPLLAMQAIDWVPADLVKYPPEDKANASFSADYWKRTTGAAESVRSNFRGHPSHDPVLPEWQSADSDDPRLVRPWLEGDR